MMIDEERAVKNVVHHIERHAGTVDDIEAIDMTASVESVANAYFSDDDGSAGVEIDLDAYGYESAVENELL